MKEILCLISSPPESANAKRGLALAAEWSKQGRFVKICLIQDGIYASLNRTAMTGDKGSVEWFALTDDLQLRGFQTKDLRSDVKTLNYEHLVQMMMGAEHQVLGAF